MRVGNKQYPSEIKNEVENVLSYYPDLIKVGIHFRWGVFTQHSFMLAQPKIPTLLLRKEKRTYQIIMRKNFFLKNRQFANGRIPSDVMVGWLSHELGHVLDYKDRSSWNLIWFGILYYFSTPFLKKAEISADKNAVTHGLIDELVVSKEFGRNPTFFPKNYVRKLNDFYPSIADVKEWAKNT
jgi:hypothetical protein